MNYAGFWLRFVAMLIDGIVLALGGGVIVVVLIFAVPSLGTDPMGMQIIANLIFVLVGLVYFVGMESSAKQGTLGKMALGLKVTDLNGNRIGVGRALGRFLGKIISEIILLIGFLMAAFTEKKQALHDMMAGTLVIR